MESFTVDNKPVTGRQFNIFMGEKFYKEFHELIKEEAQRYMKIPYNTILTLKPEMQVESGWSFHYMNELKIVPNNVVQFFSQDFLSAIQSFRMAEVIEFTIKYKKY